MELARSYMERERQKNERALRHWYDLHRLETGRKLIVGGSNCHLIKAGGAFGR